GLVARSRLGYRTQLIHADHGKLNVRPARLGNESAQQTPDFCAHRRDYDVACHHPPPSRASSALFRRSIRNVHELAPGSLCSRNNLSASASTVSGFVSRSMMASSSLHPSEGGGS